MSKETCLITGGAGFIGSHLAAQLLKRGYNVTIYDNFSSGSLSNLALIKKTVKIIKGDITDLKKLAKAFKGIDYVYHLAAFVSVEQSMKQPLIPHKINVEGTNNILEAARINGVKKVLISSSSAVYGNNRYRPYKECGATDCQSPYALSKLIGEEQARTYYKAYGLRAVIVRYFNVFGPGQNNDSPYAAVIAKFMNLAKKGDTLFIDGDGKQSRDFVFIDDVVKATILAMEKGKAGEVYNVASGKEYNLLTLSKIIEGITGKKMTLIFKPKRAGDVKKSSADITKIQKLGYKPQFNLIDGLKNIYEAQKTL